MRDLLLQGRLPECWIPSEHVLECRALLETYHALRREHTAWVQRAHAVLFHQGATRLREGGTGTAEGRELLREIAAGQLSPAGQQQIGLYLRMLEVSEVELDALRWAADRRGPPPGRREGAAGAAVRGGAGYRPGADLLAGRRGPVLLRPQGRPVRRAGHYRVLQRRQGVPRAPVPGRDPRSFAGALYEAGKVHAHGQAPDHGYYAQVKDRIDGKRAALSEARKIIRQACHLLAELGDDALATG